MIKNIHLIKDGHENMDRYLQEQTADVICFNFGYLPGGRPQHCNTHARTSVTAIEKGLTILKSGGDDESLYLQRRRYGL